jgi:cytochrome c6
VSLRSVDRLLALATWVVAAALALMLLIGPQVVADDKGKATKAASPYAAKGASAPDGQALFKDNCGTCHTLSAAGTNGLVGPKLDGLGINAATVRQAMHDGPGAMPSFDGQLSAGEAAAVAAFVARASQ